MTKDIKESLIRDLTIFGLEVSDKAYNEDGLVFITSKIPKNGTTLTSLAFDDEELIMSLEYIGWVNEIDRRKGTYKPKTINLGNSVGHMTWAEDE